MRRPPGPRSGSFATKARRKFAVACGSNYARFDRFRWHDSSKWVALMINTAGSGVDGLAKVSSVFAVVEAAKAGASDASRAARGFFPAVGRAFVTGVHATGYAVGYGTTFPVYLVGRLLPKNNPVGYGCIDGGAAGLDLARQTLGYASNAAAETAAAPVPAIAMAAADA